MIFQRHNAAPVLFEFNFRSFPFSPLIPHHSIREGVLLSVLATMASRQAATLPTLNPKRRRRVRLGTTAVFVTLLALVGAANVLIHKAFQLQKATQQQTAATANAKRTSTSDNNWKPPSADRFAAASNKNDIGSDVSISANNGEGADDHPLAGLDCAPHGGPDNQAAAEMVFWEDIESDSRYKSPFFREDGPTQYLTFEPDHGGWNNIASRSLFSLGLHTRSRAIPNISTNHSLTNPHQK